MKKYAFYPGCVARGGAPELYQSSLLVLDKLGIETIELDKAACTGAGVLQEKNQKLGDVLNIRTLAFAEDMNLPIITICSTCQGVMSQANHRVLKNPEYLEEINSELREEGLEYKGSTEVKHLLWILIEDIGLNELQKTFKKELKGFNFAPFYGCYIVRPSDALGFSENPERQHSLDMVINSTGASVTDFSGKTKCCGFPILLINQKNSLKMVSNHTGEAKDKGADAMVTPCPLCHLNLDGYQGKARKDNRGDKGDLPIIHLPQLLGLAMGIEPYRLGFARHIVSTKDFISSISPGERYSDPQNFNVAMLLGMIGFGSLIFALITAIAAFFILRAILIYEWGDNSFTHYIDTCSFENIFIIGKYICSFLEVTEKVWDWGISILTSLF
ncbi:MAG: heterodisulfide reductase [Chloroflexi bacterium]|nr:heterodisulfide reductase [Chloroflexota bacterium]